MSVCRSEGLRLSPSNPQGSIAQLHEANGYPTGTDYQLQCAQIDRGSITVDSPWGERAVTIQIRGHQVPTSVFSVASCSIHRSQDRYRRTPTRGLREFGWTHRRSEENPVRRIGRATAGSCAASAQFRQNSVWHFAKCAAERFRQFRAGDATDATLRTVSRWSLGRWRAGLIEQEATEITEFRFHFNKYLKGQSDALAVFKGVGDDS